MAAADYRLCDVCERKAFYDANLNYEQLRYPEPGVLFNGRPSYAQLGYLGAWAVLCEDCAKTHKALVVPNGTAAVGEGEA
jgi:hypothetical protein